MLILGRRYANYLRLAMAVSRSSASLPLAAVKRDDVCITDCPPPSTAWTLQV